MNHFFHDNILKIEKVPDEMKNMTLSFVYLAVLLLVKSNYGLCYDHAVLFPLVVLMAWFSNHVNSLFINFPRE